jgi:endonuclease/exonuclease/phosphatase family metal-dependent hydrolase
MSIHLSRPSRRAVAAAAAAALTSGFGLAAALPALAAPPSAPPGKPLTVMTRNLYLGGDINRPLRATAGTSGAAALVAFGNSNDELRAVVDRTDFPVRSKLLAAEIARQQPDVVGLQEVALWRSGPLELTAIGTANAATVDLDFLAILTADLAATGARYRVVNVQQESDVEGPAFRGNPFAGTMTQPRDVRLTMRDAMLVRVDAGLTVQASGGAQYATRLSVNVGGVPFVFIRGYNWADVRSGSTVVRVVNTHLESASSDIALGQAHELLAGPAAPSGNPTIVVCDCNSDPLDHSVKSTDPLGTPHSGPYDFVVGSGFTDEWLAWQPGSCPVGARDDGCTSGLSEEVVDTTAAGFDHRIDMVFARTASGAAGVDRGTVTGNAVTDRDAATGLWPSDHAGVVLRLRGLR